MNDDNEIKFGATDKKLSSYHIKRISILIYKLKIYIDTYVYFVITSIITLVIPVLVASTFVLYYPKYDNIFYETVSVFVSSLILFHIILRANRLKSTVAYIKSLDYIYLSVAALGLLSTIEIARSDVESKYKNSLDYVMKYSNDIIKNSTRPIAIFCKEEQQSDECEFRREYNDNLTRLFPVGKLTKLSDYEPFVDFVIGFAQFGARQRDYILDFHLASGMKRLISESPFPGDLFFPNFSKHIGYLLLASALALRLTRVTAEVRKWHV